MYKEFNQILNQARQGNPSSKEELLTRLKPLIIHSIKRYYYRKEEFEDLVQEGYLVILDCLESYDEDKGVKFLGYAKLSLKYHYLNKHKEKIHLSLNTLLGDTEEEWIDLLQSEEDNQEDIILKNEQTSEIINAIYQLPYKQRETILAYYVCRKSIQEIAEDQGVSYRTVVNTKTNAIKKLRTIIKR